ncbi:MAG: photosynthesis system II assembly factor Ycf48 [Pseudanabaenales cyanobacterium]|nr:photosynthesis system II assembly factor Ycf48 [Pseudanabaenales cyanobacterium]
MQLVLKHLRKIFAVLAIAFLTTSCASYFLPSLEKTPWEILNLPTDSTLTDVAFTNNLNHGWLVGSDSTLMETTDGGQTWKQRSLDLGDQRYVFTSVSFSGQEGWVTGQPNILLHTEDGGQTWLRVPLNSKLPGAPIIVSALGPDTAELSTDIGAIYRTKDGGRNWKALILSAPTVEGAIGAVRNLTRSADGQYVAVSSRGSFYSTWKPGEATWTPHNRETSRKLQNMGFAKDGKLWLIARGGQIQFGASDDFEDWTDPINPESATSWGFLDMDYRTPDEIWVSGGGGTLLGSYDGGQTWFKDRTVEDVPSNLYRIVFVTPDKGFIFGQRGAVLRYVGPSKTA